MAVIIKNYNLCIGGKRVNVESVGWLFPSRFFFIPLHEFALVFCQICSTSVSDSCNIVSFFCEVEEIGYREVIRHCRSQNSLAEF